MKLLLPLLFVLAAMNILSQMPPIEPGVSQELARWRAAHYSDVRYKLNLTLEKMSPVLKGTIEIRVTVARSEPPASAGGQSSSPSGAPIIFDWRKLSGHEKDSTISNVSVNGKPVSMSANWPPPDGGGSDFAEHLIFSEGVVAGENVIKLDFTSPILKSGSAITRYIDKEDGSEYIYSLFVPSDASTAFPVFDQPDLKARFSLQVVAPEDWRIISNGMSDTPLLLANLEAEMELEWAVCGENDKCHQDYKKPQHNIVIGFVETKPISTYVFAFAAGPWMRVAEPPALAGGVNSTTSDVKVPPPAYAGGSAFYVRKSQAAKFQPHAAEVYKLTREGVKYLEEYFDYKFPFPKYDLVLIPEFPFGGMEHAGATFLRESSIIFPSEPTANDYISRANLIFHETAHQWFGDTVTMRWFDDLWLKEGFAEFMAYKTLERVMPQYNAWKAFYERNKPAAYFTDSTRGTTPIYQPIENLSAAKSAYGNIVYRKAPSFLRQAEFYLGPDKFQTAVRTFLKKHAYANATWQDLVSEFEGASRQDLKVWATAWVKQLGLPVFNVKRFDEKVTLTEPNGLPSEQKTGVSFSQRDVFGRGTFWPTRLKALFLYSDGSRETKLLDFNDRGVGVGFFRDPKTLVAVLPNYCDYGYGIFLLDDRSRDYVLKNIQNEKDDFLRSMMWGSLWDSVREAELDPRQYVELAIKVLSSNFSWPGAKQTPAKAGTQNSAGETDEMIIASVLNRVSTAMTYYLSEPPASAGGQKLGVKSTNWPAANAAGSDLSTRLEAMLIAGMRNSPTLGQRLTYYRAFLNIVSTENGRNVLKAMLRSEPAGSRRSDAIPLKTKDRFDIVTRLAILGDPDAAKLLAELEKAETSDDAKRYAYAAHAAFATRENREKFWNDFVNNKDISESWVEAAMGPFNSPKHSDLSLPYLERALKELPNLKRNRKIFFVNGWLGAFIGGQKSQAAADIVNKFLADNPNLDRDLRLKILENIDIIERAVKIRSKYEKS